MSRPKTIITVDSGASNGGIAFWRSGDPVKVVRMPKALPDLKPYFEHVKEVDPEAMVFLEKVQMFHSDTDNPGKQFRIKQLLANYEQIKALVVLYGFRYVEVYPQSWQSTLKLREKTKGMEDKDRKAFYKQFAQNCFPEVSVTLWSSDALCLVQFALQKFDNYPEWIHERVQNDRSGQLFG